MALTIRTRVTRATAGSLALLLTVASARATAQASSEHRALVVRTTHAAGPVYLLDTEDGNSGGNVAASVGPDGILLVDDMFSVAVPALVTAARTLSKGDIRWVVNTHFHRDHIEGNGALSHVAPIIAHDNVLKRLSMTGSWAGPDALPTVTFSDQITLRFNGEDVRIVHMPNGHTDGDAYVYFTQSHVIHLGDTFFNGMFPAVYRQGGGDVLQMITNLDAVLRELPDDVKVIPGHGAMATRAELVAYVAMLRETTTIVRAAIAAGETVPQLMARNAFARYAALGEGGAQTTEQYMTMLFGLLKR